VIHPNHFGHARLAHQAFEGLQGALKLHIGLRPARQQVTAVAITHRQGIATLAIAQKKPTFEVHRPNLIGPCGNGQPVVERLIHSWFAPPRRAHAVPTENLRNCTARGRRGDAVFDLQHLVQLLGPPRLMQSPFRQYQSLYRLSGATRKSMRSMAAHG